MQKLLKGMSDAGKKSLILQTVPDTTAGQVNFCRDYCAIYENHKTRW